MFMVQHNIIIITLTKKSNDKLAINCKLCEALKKSGKKHRILKRQFPVYNLKRYENYMHTMRVEKKSFISTSAQWINKNSERNHTEIDKDIQQHANYYLRSFGQCFFSFSSSLSPSSRCFSFSLMSIELCHRFMYICTVSESQQLACTYKFYAF